MRLDRSERAGRVQAADSALGAQDPGGSSAQRARLEPEAGRLACAHSLVGDWTRLSTGPDPIRSAGQRQGEWRGGPRCHTGTCTEGWARDMSLL